MNKHAVIFFEKSGQSSGHEEMLHAAEEYLGSNGYGVDVVAVNNSGQWQIGERDVVQQEVLDWCDYAYIASNGPYVRSGALQSVLDTHTVPYNGSDALMNRICSSVSATRDLLKIQEISTPLYEQHHVLDGQEEQTADYIFQNFPQPCILRADTDIAGDNLFKIESKQDALAALRALRSVCEDIVVEEYIQDHLLQVGLVENLRDQDLYTIPAVSTEMLLNNSNKPHSNQYSLVSDSVAGAGDSVARQVHRTLQLAGYSQVDLYMHPNRGVLVVGVHTLPTISQDNSWGIALDSVGITYQECIKACIEKKQ